MTVKLPGFDSSTSRTTGTIRMTGHVLWGLRIVWGVLALVTLGLFVIGIPNQLQLLLQAPEFAPEILQQVGISPQVVAWYDLSLDLLQTSIFFFMAVLLFVRRSDDRMALLTSLTLITWGSTALTSIITGLTRPHPEIALPINLIMALGEGLIVYFGTTFPDGRFRPRWVAWMVIPYAVWQIISVLFPALPITKGNLPDTLVLLIQLGVYNVGFSVQIYRFRRVLHPEQVQQGKWVVFGLGAAVFGFILVILPSLLLTTLDDSNVPAFFYEVFLQTTLLFALSALPVTMAFSILRHRLWDVDFIINRSLVYGTLTVGLGLVFLGSMLVFQAILELLTGGRQSVIALTASALVIGFLFNPVRNRLRRLIDQRVYGIQIDYERKRPAFQSLPVGQPHKRRLGSYEIMEAVGRGGMAEVFKALHPTLNRTVAVKILAPHMVFDDDSRTRFEREARALAAMRHPNIVQMYDFGEQDEIYYMVMEYVAGPDLDQHLREHGPLPVEQVCAWFRDIASALDYAHEQGVVHRDIKPANVMLQSTESGVGTPIVTDFGLARISQGGSQSTQGVVGTLDYIAPEQIRNVPDIDGRADVYALGVMAFEMLTGKLPFVAANPAALLMAHMSQPPADPRSLRPELDHRISAAVLRALEKERTSRYATAGEFATAMCG